MMESIHKYFRLGTLSWMSFPTDRYDPVDAVRHIARDGDLDAVEIADYKDPEVKKQIRHILNQSHLSVAYGAQPVILGENLNPNSLDEPERRMAQERLLEAMEDAKSFGASGFSFMAGAWCREGKEEALSQLKKTARALCSRGSSLGMAVELEVFDFDLDKKVLIGPAPLAARFAAEMRQVTNNFGLLADLSHFPTTYEDSAFAVRAMRPYLTHFHIGNAVVTPEKDAYGDKHPRFGYPHGANDVGELYDFFTVLRQEGFFNSRNPVMLSAEVTPRPGEEAEIVLANTKRVINRAWSVL